MDTNPQSIHDIALLLPLAVGAVTTMGSIIVHGVTGRSTILLVARVFRQDWSRPSFLRDSGTITGTAMLLLSAHLLEIILWALVLMMCGQFHQFGPACYHSAVNYTTLGYGDIVMSPQWRFLGPLEGLAGMLLVGLSTAVLFSVVQQVGRRSFPDVSKELFGL